MLYTAVIAETKFLCESIAPFGGPVVPLVYENVKQSSSFVLNCS